MKRRFDELAEVVLHAVRFDRMTLFLADRRFEYGAASATPVATSIIPLFACGSLVGRLHVTRGSAFTQEERNALAYLSPHLAVSVQTIAESDVRRRLLDEAEALLEIGKVTAALHVPAEVVSTALAVVARYLPYPTQFAVFGDPDESGRWSLLGARIPSMEKLYALQAMQLSAAELGPERVASLEAGEPFFVPDATTEKTFAAEMAVRFGARSLLTVPLRSGKTTLGAVFVCDPTTNIAFSPVEQKLIRGVADQVSISVRNARLVRENTQSVEYLRALSKRLWTVQEEERERIARELHDEAGQAMTALKLNLDLARRESDLTRVRARIAEAADLAGTVLEELRRISSDLRPGGLHELGLVPTLRALVEGFGKRNGLVAEFDSTAEVVPHPDSDAASTAFRFVQEALTNVARHAHASWTRVSLENTASGLFRITVEDDGVGFGSSSLLDGQLGLLGMRERARVLGGSLLLELTLEKGARLVLEIPNE